MQWYYDQTTGTVYFIDFNLTLLFYGVVVSVNGSPRAFMHLRPYNDGIPQTADKCNTPPCAITGWELSGD